MLRPLSTQLGGSYVKPPWLVRPERMQAFVEGSWWRPEGDVLQGAREDAVRLAVFDQDRAGRDILTDGEQQWQNYASHCYTRFTGVDARHLAPFQSVSEITTVTPRVFSDDEMALRSQAPQIVDEIA